MKKFFKILKKIIRILRQIIKILLKMIIYLILWIIVIWWIILAIINNKTLKIYENDNGDMRFTMDKSFVVENWVEIKLSLNNLNLTVNEINDLKIDYKYVSDVDFREWTITINWIELGDLETPWWYIDIQNIIKLKKINFEDIKQWYKNWNIKNIFEIFKYFVDWEIIFYYNNWQIDNKLIYINWLEIWSMISYYENWQIKEEFNYLNWDDFWIQTWYYNNGYIKYLINEDWNWTGFYENWNIKWIQNKSWYNKYYENWNLFEEFNYIDWDNWNWTGFYIDWKIFSHFTWKYFDLENNHSDFYYTYLDKNWKILWNYQEENYDRENRDYQKKNWLFIDMYDNGQIKEKWNYIEWDYDWYRVKYFDNWEIFKELNYENWNFTWYWTWYYKNWKIFNIVHFIDNENYSIIYYGENENILWKLVLNNNEPGWLYMTRYFNWQIGEKWKFIDWKPDWYRVWYFENGKIYYEWNYNNWKRVWVWNRYLWDWSIWVSKDYWWNEKIDN